MTAVSLLIVDMQNAYFNNDALKADQNRLVQKCNELIGIIRRSGGQVFNIRTVHDSGGSTWTLNMLDDHEGYLFKGSKDAENIPGLTLNGTADVIKTRDSAFYGTGLLTMLRRQNIDRAILCGVSTHTCVAQTAADGYAANIEIILASEAIASHKPRYHQVALDMLHTEYRQPVLDNKKIAKVVG